MSRIVRHQSALPLDAHPLVGNGCTLARPCGASERTQKLNIAPDCRMHLVVAVLRV